MGDRHAVEIVSGVVVGAAQPMQQPAAEAGDPAQGNGQERDRQGVDRGGPGLGLGPQEAV